MERVMTEWEKLMMLLFHLDDAATAYATVKTCPEQAQKSPHKAGSPIIINSQSLLTVFFTKM